MDTLNKMCFTVFLFLFTGCMLASAAVDKNIGKDRAWEIVKKEILKEKIEGKEVYVSIDLLKAGEAVKCWGKSYTVPENFQQAWLFFVDDQPGANWGHACRYIFVDAAGGKYKIIESRTPPDSMDMFKPVYKK